jgi:hypothetical protein
MSTTTIGAVNALQAKILRVSRIAAGGTKLRRRTGRGLSTLAVLFLAFDAVVKLVQAAPVGEALAQHGMTFDVAVGVAILQLACIALYLIPITSALGAVLLTGFLGSRAGR